MRVGLRVIKTGIAVSVSMMVAVFLGVRDPFYSAIAAIVVMQPTVSDTWKIGANRMLGTLVGALVGLVFVTISPANPVLAGVGIIILIIILSKMGRTNPISIGGVVYLAILLNTEGGNVSYTVHRLIDTGAGIIVAVIVNYGFFPPNYDNRFIKETRRASKDMWRYNQRMLNILIGEEIEDHQVLDDQVEEIERELERSDKLFKMKLKENKVDIYDEFKGREMGIVIKLEKEVFQHLKNMQGILRKGINQEVIDIIIEDIKNVRNSMDNLQNKGDQILSDDLEDGLNFDDIIAQLKEAKIKLKQNEEINQYPTDEVVKLMVFLYNLEEMLSKENMIFHC